MPNPEQDELVEAVAYVIAPWDKKLDNYCGENPVIERGSAEEFERASKAREKANKVIPLIERALLEELREWITDTAHAHCEQGSDLWDWERSQLASLKTFAKEKRNIVLSKKEKG